MGFIKGLNMKSLHKLMLYLVLTFCISISHSYSKDKIAAKVINFSDMNKWVRITDMVCKEELYKDVIEAKSNLPIELCKDDEGFGKIELYIRIGCSKNKTIIKEKVQADAKIAF